MRVGVLTGGGDCPGLNAVIRAVVRKGVAEYGFEFVGFRDGWRGPLEGDTVPLDIQAVRGILQRKGVGASLLVEQAKPLRLAEFSAPPPVYPVSGTQGAVPMRPVGESCVPVLA